ncbi:MAG: biopolymer transporter ExbD [Proteobacteria bacterium]|nr:MAG: biopolymer transporter ExbD [Pseudomonadota bacterium]
MHSLPSADESTGDDIVAEINITPLTDIFLVLLIIFMVTTSVISSQGKEVDLPSSAVASQTPAGVTVTLSADEQIAVDGQIVKDDQLAPALEAALAKAKDKVVILRGDRDVVLGRAVGILDVAQEAGAKGIALATKPPGPGEKKAGAKK